MRRDIPNKTGRALVLALLISALPSLAWAAPAERDTAGVVRSCEGQVAIIRGGQALPAPVGTRLRSGDALDTGPDGSIGILLRDDSVLSLGPGSRLVIKEFLFKPAQGKIGLVARITRGTMAYISGLIGKLAPEKARFETPTASIGIRGTFFAVKVGEPPPS